MNSFFYSTKHAKTSYYHIPSTLNLEDVQQIFHNHSTLAHIFWPQLVNDPENLLFENQIGPSTTEIQIRPASGSGPGPSGTKCKASITSHHEAREIVVAEEMPLGLRMTLVYRVSDEPPQGISAEEGDGLLALADSQPSTSLSGTGSRIGMYLQVERSVIAPRPLSMLVKTTDGPIVKTKNLLFVLDELGNGKELDAALDALNELRGSDDEGDEVLEKYKAD
ncbi:homoserine O-acetyltransferase [Aspergillus tubingensis]|uniref:homoserine O-acetyltransferase n=1 Tax=Aspergillus tubingensis TaxID=5068 RepID=UPI001577BA18|nr:homoserine O-acetyltransferase [Aspergillus tubingensis]GFN20356.1 homoserine O-acetyltransferase [Aspergillus tubingensis]